MLRYISRTYKVALKKTVSISLFIVLLMTNISSGNLFKPLVINGHVESSPSDLTHGVSKANGSGRNTNPLIATTTKSTSEPISMVTTTNSTQVQFLGQTFTRALQLPAVQIGRLEHAILFHHRDPSAFAFAQEEVQSVNSRIKVLTQRQPVYQQQHLLQQPRIAQTILSPFPFHSASSPSLNSSLTSQVSSSASMNKVISGFDGLTQSQAGFNGLTYFPPDVPLAVGPNYVVQMVNLAGEVFTKQGVSVSTFALPTFFKVSGINDSLSDPRIIYDSISGRWFASLGDGTTDDVRVAVSTTNDPTGSWNIYRFGVSNCPDRPGIGVNNDKFAISTNLFSSSCDGAFMGVQYYIVDKADLVNGITAPRFVQTVPDTSIFSVYPVQSLSSSSTLYMVSVGDDQSNSITIYSFSGTIPNKNIALSVVSLPIQTTHIPPGALQPGTTTRLDTGDARVEDAVWYQGKMWLAFNDACTPPGDTQSRACIRLDQIDTNVNKVLQDFDKGEVGVYQFYPGLEIDGSGNLDFIYGYSSTSTYPSLAASGQSVGSALDMLIQPIILKLGSADDPSGRYGDYFEAAVDPSNTNVIWVAGEYHSSPGWSTFISAVNQQPGKTTSSLHATSLTLNELMTSVPWGTGVTFTGRLTDNNASNMGIGGKTVTFTGTGSANVANAVTNTDGTFTTKSIAPDTVATGWAVQAHFAADFSYQASDSTTQSYNTLAHTTTLTLKAITTNVPSGTTVTVTGKLTDNDASNRGIVGKTITFTGTGASNITSLTTNPDGTFTAAGTAPTTVATGWTVQAHFAADRLYGAADSTVQSYNTVRTTPIPPDTSITSAVDGNGITLANSGSTISTSIQISFTGKAGSNSIAGFECNVDGRAFSSCSSPTGITNLAAGTQQNFQVRAVDTAGNRDPTPATFSWTIATVTPPSHTTIASAVDGNGAMIQNGGTTKSSSVKIAFTAVQGSNPIAGFQCSFDNSPFSSCSSPVALNNLVAGPHTFEVVAVDNAGNKDPNPASFRWTILTATLEHSLEQLIQIINGMHLNTGIQAGLDAQLNAVLTTISSPINNNLPFACPRLNALTNTVIPGYLHAGQLNSNQAAQLIQSILAIRTALHCNPTPPAQQALIANAGPNQAVSQGSLVTLDGVGSGGTIVSYSWVQTAGIHVLLNGVNTATPTFVAPTLPYDTMLAFSLKVIDNGGVLSVNPAIVYVTVKHNPSLNDNSNFGVDNAAPGSTINQPQQRHEQLLTPPNNIIGRPSDRAFPPLPSH